MAIEFARPAFARRHVHLARMGLPNDAGEKARRFHCIGHTQVFEFDLEILWQHFAYKHRFPCNFAGDHSFAEMRRQMHRAFDDALRLVPRHLVFGVTRGSRSDGLLDIHQCHVALLARSNRKQHRKTQ